MSEVECKEAKIKVGGDPKEAVSALDTIMRKLHEFAESSEKLAQKIFFFGGAFKEIKETVLGLFEPMFEEGSKFEEAMSRVKMRMVDVRDGTVEATEKFEKLSNVALETARNSHRSAVEIAQAFGVMAQKGMESVEAIRQLPVLMATARVSGQGLVETFEIVHGIMEGFDMDEKNFQKASDTLVAITQETKMTMQEFGRSMQFLGPMMKQAGIDAETAGAMIGVLGKHGMSGRRSMTAMMTALEALTHITPKAAKILEEYGLTVEQVSIETTGSLEKSLQIMEVAGLKGSALHDAFNQRTARVFQILQKSGNEVAATHEKIAKNIGMTQDVAARKEEKAEEVLEKLKNEFGDIKKKMFLEFGDDIKNALHWLKDLVHGINDWVVANKEAVKTVGSILIGIGSFTVIMTSASFMVGKFAAALAMIPATFATVVTSIVSGAHAIASAVTASFTLMMAHPLIAAIAAVGAVIVGIVMATQAIYASQANRESVEKVEKEVQYNHELLDSAELRLKADREHISNMDHLLELLEKEDELSEKDVARLREYNKLSGDTTRLKLADQWNQKQEDIAKMEERQRLMEDMATGHSTELKKENYKWWFNIKSLAEEDAAREEQRLAKEIEQARLQADAIGQQALKMKELGFAEDETTEKATARIEAEKKVEAERKKIRQEGEAAHKNDKKELEELTKLEREFHNKKAIEGEIDAIKDGIRAKQDELVTISKSIEDKKKHAELTKNSAELIKLESEAQRVANDAKELAAEQERKIEEIRKKALDNQQKIVDELNLEVLRTKGDRKLDIARAEIQKEEDEFQKKLDKEFELDGKNNERILAARKRAQDLHDQLMNAQLRKAHEEDAKKDQKDLAVHVKEHADVQRSVTAELAKQVHSVADMLFLYQALAEARHQQDQRAAVTAVQVVNMEQRINDLRERRDKQAEKGGDVKMIDRQIARMEVLANVARQRATREGMFAQLGDAGGQEEVKSNQKFKKDLEAVQTGIANTAGAIRNVLHGMTDTFAKAPVEWINAFLSSWDANAQRMVGAVTMSMHGIAAGILPPAPQALAMGGMGAATRSENFNDNRAVNMNINNYVDMTEVRRTIGNALLDAGMNTGTV